MNDLQGFKSLPLHLLPASASVDFLHLIFFNKPAIRTYCSNDSANQLLSIWCKQYGYSLEYDDTDYICIAKTQHLAKFVLEVDQRAEPHEYLLGQLLGYPECCSQFVAQKGESLLDELENEIALWKFEREFRLIDPSDYLSGSSLICHLPCSTVCCRSLNIAQKVISFLKTNAGSPCLGRWFYWLDRGFV